MIVIQALLVILIIKNIVEIFQRIVWDQSPSRWCYILIVASALFGALMNHIYPLG